MMGKRKLASAPPAASKGKARAEQIDRRIQLRRISKQGKQNLIWDYFLRSCDTPAPTSILGAKELVLAPAMESSPRSQVKRVSHRMHMTACKRWNTHLAQGNIRSNSCSALDDMDTSIAELLLLSSDESQGSLCQRVGLVPRNQGCNNTSPPSQGVKCPAEFGLTSIWACNNSLINGDGGR